MDYSLPALLCLWHMKLLVRASTSGVVLPYISQGGYEELVNFHLNTIYTISSPRVELGAAR